MIHFDDIKDDEIRLISRHDVIRKPFHKRGWFWVSVAVICLLVSVSISLLVRSCGSDAPKTAHEVAESVAVAPIVVDTQPADVLVFDTIINDVPLRIHTPVNAVPELVMGIPDTNDESIILLLQAADIRADNQEIVGAFVLKGELLSRGIAKKGFCAILDGKIHLGMAESTPLFEEATSKNGYFFRQYPLVSAGQMVENKPKNKALRHALCELDGQIVIVSSLDKESFHDFAQAVADLGVQNAIVLTGGSAYGYYRDLENGFKSWGADVRMWQNVKNVNFIAWRKL